MATLTIEINDEDWDFFEKLLKKLNAKIIQIEDKKSVPNDITMAAIAEARSGKSKKIEDLELYFKNL